MKTVPMGSFATKCDCCGETGPIANSLWDSLAESRAVAMAEGNGWKEVSYGMLKNTLCPKCVEEHQRLLSE